MGTEHAQGPVWAREAARRRPKLTREAIVAAAIRIADGEGADAVSIRRVATELGARAMSLYTHIERKEDLLDLMTDEVSAEILIKGELPGDWREAISAIARRTREMVRRHPWLVDLVSRRPNASPNGLRHAEQSLAALSALPLTTERRLWIIAAVDDYTMGSVIREVLHTPRRYGGAEAERDDLMQPYLRELVDSGEFPHLAPLLGGGVPNAGGGSDEDFERGLRWLLDGIAGDLLRE
ncbi:TetR/AcrR family transcriptional regulator C-terminal domain-containing protein [Streptosporangium sp. NBC_01639]|uniref:TetR/AcrR family transcriptional regulator C-terminal domain-containing protein n=1 Tax=Streptosporangium sp. NBC_01639 TaxID=2975948 RepID=UPI00386D98FB|nr:TetR/AcrR family transcriptional regulator C-terminal domain-containing protein [Streptosporangium sp. NBC_01639]